jgi:hypothetical protein
MIPNSNSLFNKWADFWRYEIGLNVIPADTKNKRIYEKWLAWQNEGVNEEQHTEWKERNAFANGMAIIVGKVLHRPDLDGYHLCFIDLDNQKAIDAICGIFGAKDIKELSQTTIVEQHLDNDSKAHIYFYTKYVLKKKSSDTTRNLKDKLDSNAIPAIEVKCQSDGLAYCTPSPHKDGHNYEIIGTKKIGIFEGMEIENMLFEVYRKYGLTINDGEKNGLSYKIPIKELFKPGFKIKEGHNRSEAVLRVAESLYTRYGNTKSLEEIRQQTYKWMVEHCDPPLEQTKFERQFNDGINFVDKTSTKDQRNILQQQLKIKNEENTIFKIVDYSIPYKAYYVDEKLSQVCYGRLAEDGLFPLKSIINIMPKKIIFYINPLFPKAEPKVELEFYVNSKKELKKLGPYNSLTELLRELQNKGHVLNKARAEDAFNSIKNAMEEKDENLIEYITDVTTSGYYLINEKLVKKNVTQSIEEIRKEDAIECCNLLNYLSTGWKNKDVFPTVLKWGMISPFSFIVKCNGSYSRWIPWLQLYGFGDSGKTTLGEITIHIWNLNSQEHSSGFGNLDTPAKFGHYVSADTYPKLVNEPGNLYTNLKGRFNGVIEMIKSSVEGKTARSKFFDYKNYQEIPALSPIMFASNYPPINDGSYNRRFVSIHFPEDEKKEEEEKQIFRKVLEEKKIYLKVLGDYVSQYISKDPIMLLKEDWKDVSKKILNEFYGFAEMDIPEWIEYFVEQKDAVDESKEKTQSALRAFFRNKINEVYSRNKDLSNNITGLNEKLEYCLRNELISFLHDMKGNIIVTHDIMDEIKRGDRIENITSLKDIGSQVGFEYVSKYINNKKMRVLEGTSSKLLKFINPDIVS